MIVVRNQGSIRGQDRTRTLAVRQSITCGQSHFEHPHSVAGCTAEGLIIESGNKGGILIVTSEGLAKFRVAQAVIHSQIATGLPAILKINFVIVPAHQSVGVGGGLRTTPSLLVPE